MSEFQFRNGPHNRTTAQPHNVAWLAQPNALSRGRRRPRERGGHRVAWSAEAVGASARGSQRDALRARDLVLPSPCTRTSVMNSC